MGFVNTLLSQLDHQAIGTAQLQGLPEIDFVGRIERRRVSIRLLLEVGYQSCWKLVWCFVDDRLDTGIARMGAPARFRCCRFGRCSGRDRRVIRRLNQVGVGATMTE